MRILKISTTVSVLTLMAASQAQSAAVSTDIFVDTGITTTNSAVISDPTGDVLTIRKTGAGTLILSGSNTYTGDTYVDAGTLQHTLVASLPATNLHLAAGTVLKAGADLDFSSTNQVLNVDGAATVNTNSHILSLQKTLVGSSLLTVSGSGTLALGGASAPGSATTFTGGITLGSSTTLYLKYPGVIASNRIVPGNGTTIKFDAGTYTCPIGN